MTEAQETNDKDTAAWMAGQTFESASDAIQLDGLMSNDDMAKRGILCIADF